MRDPFKELPKDSNQYPQVVERVEHSVNWTLLCLAFLVVVLIVCWPLLYEFVVNQTEEIKQSETVQTDKEIIQDAPKTASFDEILDTALRHDRQGDRVMADKLFRKLLMEAAKNPVFDEQTAALLPRAADFYSKGDEIPVKEIENLYLDALDAIRQVHGQDYYDYEIVYTGLEKHYTALHRYEEAANQTRLLLDFYRRYYKDNQDALYAMIQPTTVRYGQNLMQAGKYNEARNAYQIAIDMARGKGQPVAHLEDLIKKTYQQKKGQASVPANRSPVSNSIGLDTSMISSTSSANQAGSDLKSAIEKITLTGIYVEALLENEDRVTITGYAKDNKIIAKYTRLLYEEAGEPVLNMVRREERKGKPVNAFSIKMKK